MLDLQNTLKTYFKLDNFRNNQESIIKSVLDKKDTLVFMPTWWWKSLTYQLPWVILDWLTIVISPLISLQKDQVDKLNSLKIRSEVLNSTLSNIEKIMILEEISLWNSIKFLYVAPERLYDKEFLETIKNIKISQIVIDEAHCISQWWHDFRPSYLKIKDFINDLREKTIFPIIALTATATPKVKQDIIKRLWLEIYNSFTSWFDRKNLGFIVREISKEDEKLQKVLEIIQKIPPFWIIYCSSVKNVSKVYQFLLWEWIRVWIYNWEMNWNLREKEQNNFMNWNYDVIVATNAFGMWIDKADIRYVIHYNLPWSIENYYQEVWRAWRDGKNSYWIILASYQDTIIQEFFIENSYPPKEDILKFYNYLYKDFELWDGKNHIILKTYNSMAIESGVWSDLKVWSILNIMQKYDILKKWYNDFWEQNDFRWRWITLLLPKLKEENIPILWMHQELLKNESYFKLEQVKKLLFRPGCRKKFILEYFQDEDDLKNLKNNCQTCDYCIDQKKMEKMEIKDIIPYNQYILILEFIKRFDNKFWSQILAWILTWSKEKKLTDWNLDLDKDFWSFEIYSKNFVLAIFDTLIENEFLYKSSWQYPKIGLTSNWINALFNTKIIIDNFDKLNNLLYFKTRFLEKKDEKIKKIKVEKIDTYTETLNLLKENNSLKEISVKRELWLQTIEDHIVKLYQFNKLTLSEIIKFSNIEKLKKVKNVIKNNSLEVDKLKPIKELLESDISYFDIKLAISMIDKKDL